MKSLVVLLLIFMTSCDQIGQKPVETPIKLPENNTSSGITTEPVTPPVVTLPPVPVKVPSKTIDDLKIVADSTPACAKYKWKERGAAPISYMRGMAVAYAKAQCNITKPEVAVVAQAATKNEIKDALAWHQPEFTNLGLSVTTPGRDTLRHAYVLLIGLGMRESAGKHCSGRDMSADFSTANSAEAGLFQGSWGASRAHETLPEMMDPYLEGTKKCYLDTFNEGVKCKESSAVTWGTGKGAIYQKLAKECPMFAVEYSAVLIRTTGGSKGEFGPLRRKAAEIKTECNDMLKKVDTLVDEDPSICSKL